MIGIWIDGLTDEQRDRIVSATHWTGDRGWFVEPDGCTKCLVGHAAGWFRNEGGFQDCRADFRDPVRGDARNIHGLEVYNIYPRLVARFGLDRTVRAIKLRAGAKVEIGEHTP